MYQKFFLPILMMALMGGGITLSACTDSPSLLSDSSIPTDTNPSKGDALDAESPIPMENPWITILGEATLPHWTVEPCEGVAPFLCIYDNAGSFVGTVELQVWALQERADLAEALINAGLDPTTLNPDDLRSQNTPQRDAVLTALETLVNHFYTAIEQDWATGYGGAIAFKANPPVKVAVGAYPALLYQFQGTASDGTIQQQAMGYMMFTGEQLYLIATGAPAEEPAGFRTIEQFQSFQPYLDIVVSNLRL